MRDIHGATEGLVRNLTVTARRTASAKGFHTISISVVLVMFVAGTPTHLGPQIMSP